MEVLSPHVRWRSHILHALPVPAQLDIKQVFLEKLDTCLLVLYKLLKCLLCLEDRVYALLELRRGSTHTLQLLLSLLLGFQLSPEEF